MPYPLPLKPIHSCVLFTPIKSYSWLLNPLRSSYSPLLSSFRSPCAPFTPSSSGPLAGALSEMLQSSSSFLLLLLLSSTSLAATPEECQSGAFAGVVSLLSLFDFSYSFALLCISFLCPSLFVMYFIFCCLILDLLCTSLFVMSFLICFVLPYLLFFSLLGHEPKIFFFDLKIYTSICIKNIFTLTIFGFRF